MKTHTHSAVAAAMALGLMATALGQTSYSSSSRQSTSPDTKATSDTTNSSTTSPTMLKWSDKHFVTKVAESNQLEIAIAQLATERTSNADVRAFAQQLINDHEQLSHKLDQLADRKGLRDDLAEYTPSTMRGSSMTGPSSSTSSSTTSTKTPMTSSATNTNSTTTPNSATNYNSPTNSNNVANASINRNSSTNGSVSPQIDSNTYASGEFTGAPVSSTTNSNSDWNDPMKDRHYRKLAKKQGADFDKEFISMMVDDHEDDIAMFDKKAKNANDSDVKSFAAEALPTLQQHLQQAQQIASTQKS